MLPSVVSYKHQTRFFSSTLKTWERSAKMVKNTKVTNQYLELIRESHDPSLHIKSLEDELRGTMGKALGRQGDKIMFALGRMEEQRQRLHTLEEKNEIRECVILYNQYREEAKQARWELEVQRQAIGLLVNNQKFIHEQYPIGDALPLPQEDGTLPKNRKEKAKQEFGDQLDWWQRIGRWR